MVIIVSMIIMVAMTIMVTLIIIVAMVMVVMVIGHGGHGDHCGHGGHVGPGGHGGHCGHGHGQDRQNLYLNLAFQVTCEGQLSQFLRCFNFAHCRMKKRLSEALPIAFDILNQFSPGSLKRVQVWFGKNIVLPYEIANCLLTYKYKYKTEQRLTILIKDHFLYETTT